MLDNRTEPLQKKFTLHKVTRWATIATLLSLPIYVYVWAIVAGSVTSEYDPSFYKYTVLITYPIMFFGLLYLIRIPNEKIKEEPLLYTLLILVLLSLIVSLFFLLFIPVLLVYIAWAPFLLVRKRRLLGGILLISLPIAIMILSSIDWEIYKACFLIPCALYFISGLLYIILWWKERPSFSPSV